MVPANKTVQPDVLPPSSDQGAIDPLWKRVLNDRFTLLEPLGSGGMGKVYKAIQAPLDRMVAIKILSSNYANAQDPGFRQRFFLEASLTSKLRHPNTITVIDYGQTPDGIFFIAMEYLEGQTLATVLARQGPLHWTRAWKIAQQIGRSLREAHKIGIVHRDLKPANVMLLTEDRDDIVKVLDFGLVKSFIREENANASEVTNPGMFLGSPQYMAPEQARNHADPRSDIYSLGVVLYHMLVGRPPFVAKDSIDVIFKQMNEPPAPMRSLRPEIDLPREVESLVMKCLEKQPSWRFHSMEDVLEAMRKAASAAGMAAILADGNGSAHTPPPMQMPAEAGAPAIPEGTLAIDISVVSGLGKIPSPPLLWNRKRRAAIFLAFAAIAFCAGYALIRGMHQSRISAAVASAQAAPNATTSAEPPISATERLATPSTPAPSTLESTEQPDAPSTPAPKTVKFRISTDPQGAQVSVAGRRVGRTPVSFDVQANPDGTATAELLLTLRGYHPMTVITGGSGPEVVLTQRLQPRSPARRVIDVDRAENAPPSNEPPPPATATFKPVPD
jgi:serine/threonine-protein kinase